MLIGVDLDSAKLKIGNEVKTELTGRSRLRRGSPTIDSSVIEEEEEEEQSPHTAQFCISTKNETFPPSQLISIKSSVLLLPPMPTPTDRTHYAKLLHIFRVFPILFT
jgi:hypothetical protein